MALPKKEARQTRQVEAVQRQLQRRQQRSLAAARSSSPVLETDGEQHHPGNLGHGDECVKSGAERHVERV
jgi:hypothetical protein